MKRKKNGPKVGIQGRQKSFTSPTKKQCQENWCQSQADMEKTSKARGKKQNWVGTNTRVTSLVQGDGEGGGGEKKQRGSARNERESKSVHGVSVGEGTAGPFLGQPRSKKRATQEKTWREGGVETPTGHACPIHEVGGKKKKPLARHRFGRKNRDFSMGAV